MNLVEWNSKNESTKICKCIDSVKKVTFQILKTYELLEMRASKWFVLTAVLWDAKSNPTLNVWTEAINPVLTKIITGLFYPLKLYKG